jgi:N-acetyl-gamma-glutamyl-phosphate reductase
VKAAPRTSVPDRSSSEPVPTYVFGAKGVLAGELLRLIDGHPRLVLAGAVSRSAQSLAEAHPHLALAGHTIGADDARADIATRIARGERPAVLLALPHGESAAAWQALCAELGPKAHELYVVDLAADHRFADPARHARVHGAPPSQSGELGRFVYGLVEFDRAAVASARRVAAPGCFATAMQLACVPAARSGLVDGTHPWILHGITGSSGSGAEPKAGTHHPWRHGNLWAYALAGHRHEAELEQALDRLAVQPPLHFVAHSGPFARGIHLTCALPLATRAAGAAEELHAHYRAAFEGSPFVAVLPLGQVPDLRSVTGSNRALVGLSVRGGVLSVLVTLDNMVKGGAGQALQCLNLMLGAPESAGLPRTGLGVA